MNNENWVKIRKWNQIGFQKTKNSIIIKKNFKEKLPIETITDDNADSKTHFEKQQYTIHAWNKQYLSQTQRNRKGKQNMMQKLMGLKLKEERYNNRWNNKSVNPNNPTAGDARTQEAATCLEGDKIVIKVYQHQNR